MVFSCFSRYYHRRTGGARARFAAQFRAQAAPLSSGRHPCPPTKPQWRKRRMGFEIPSPSMTFEVPLEDGAMILMRRHGNPQGVRLLVTHGNGFAADAYFPYWQHLLDRFDVLVFDFRNHGQNIPVKPANHHYAQLCRDLERVVQKVRAQLGQKPTAGIFHSMSARTAMKHAIEIGWGSGAAGLFDPTDVPPPRPPVFAQRR